MPLFKRKPFILVDPPNNLNPDELVFQVRFTKEIFIDYQEYLNRINLYRQRVWTCKVTGKINLTYEEALVSERRATEKVQQFPKELMEPVLHMVQFSTLTLKDLVSTISSRLQEQFLQGVEFYGRRDQCLGLCKILKVLERNGENTSYEVGWLDNAKKVTETSVVSANELIRKKLPFSRDVLKSFIRESTYQSAPWVIHDKLARKHKISTEPPEELKDRFYVCDGHLSSDKQSTRNNDDHKTLHVENTRIATKKWKKQESEKNVGWEIMTGKVMEEEKSKIIAIKYPIDDLLVKPGPGDPVFTDRPSPSRDFIVPVDCVGDLLMVWDFFSSFGKLLLLWPFSLEDFGNAICHKNGNLNLVVESHSVLLHLLLKDEGRYFTAIQKKRQRAKISMVTWREYLCDFLEMEDKPELSTHIGIIRRGHYGLLETSAKLSILRELVDVALTTDAIRQQLDEYMEQQQILAATKRQEALTEAKKKREEMQPLNQLSSGSKDPRTGHHSENGALILNNLPKGNNHGQRKNMQPLNQVSSGPKDPRSGHQSPIMSECLKADDHGQNREFLGKGTLKVYSSRRKRALENGHAGESKLAFATSREGVTDQRMSAKVTPEDVTDLSISDKDEKVPRKRKKDKESENSKKKREMEKHFIRTNPLGKDRDYNRYWFFRRDGRIFVESSDSREWGYYSSKEELDLLMGSLNRKGERERALHKQLEKDYLRLCAALQKRSKDIAQEIAMEEAVVRRSVRRIQPQNSRAAPFLQYINKWKED